MQLLEWISGGTDLGDPILGEWPASFVVGTPSVDATDATAVAAFADELMVAFRRLVTTDNVAAHTFNTLTNTGANTDFTMNRTNAQITPLLNAGGRGLAMVAYVGESVLTNAPGGANLPAGPIVNDNVLTVPGATWPGNNAAGAAQRLPSAGISLNNPSLTGQPMFVAEGLHGPTDGLGAATALTGTDSSWMVEQVNSIINPNRADRALARLGTGTAVANAGVTVVNDDVTIVINDNLVATTGANDNFITVNIPISLYGWRVGGGVVAGAITDHGVAQVTSTSWNQIFGRLASLPGITRTTDDGVIPPRWNVGPSAAVPPSHNYVMNPAPAMSWGSGPGGVAPTAATDNPLNNHLTWHAGDNPLSPSRATFVMGHDPFAIPSGMAGVGFMAWGAHGGGILSYYRVTELTNPWAQTNQYMFVNTPGGITPAAGQTAWTANDFDNNGQIPANRGHLVGNVGNHANAVGRELNYRLDVNTATGMTTAVVTIMTHGGQRDRITIPLVMRTTGDGDIRVRIQSELTAIATTSLHVTTNVPGRTTATAEAMDNRVGERRFRLRIAEQRANSIVGAQPWEFELTAPRGWHWAIPGTVGSPNANVMPTTEASGFSGMFVHLEGGLHWAEGNISGQRTNSGGITVSWARDRHGRVQDDVLRIFVPADLFARNRTQVGSLLINGLRLVADDFDNIQHTEALQVGIRNVLRTEITNQTFAAGSALDFGITLNRITDNIPELISGRLAGHTRTNNAGEWEYTTHLLDDTYHKAASVRFFETTVDAWWAQRNTEFRLPEEVRFLRVEFEDARDIPNAVELYRGSNQVPGALVSADRNPWFNAGRRLGSVTVDNNRLILHNFTISPGERARFDMHMWLNTQVDFEGDIDLTLMASAFRRIHDNYDVSTTIARAVRPIEIVTQVTEARVGFQFVHVADFDIVENVAGALVQAEEVFITITDLMSLDFAFAPGFNVGVTEGNIRISNVRTAGNLGTLGAVASWFNPVGGQMIFEVERASTVPSTISFAGIQVRIDRTVPFSNISAIETTGYDIHVWGPAVAMNFRGLYEIDKFRAPQHTNDWFRNERDYFAVGSIHVPYVTIETAGEFGAPTFRNHVEVPIPSSVVRINSVETELGVETWICPVSSSAMVPVRFIAYALGLPGEAVNWDPINSTVTIDAGHRIVQFQTGNSAYLVNGAAVRMMNSEGVPVEMQIRNERSFVPFRALGEAFGIPVSWDPDRAVAIYNAPTHF